MFLKYHLSTHYENRQSVIKIYLPIALRKYAYVNILLGKYLIYFMFIGKHAYALRKYAYVNILLDKYISYSIFICIFT